MVLIANTTQSLTGSLTVPGSKSHSIRALLLALLAKGKSHLSNVLDSDDTQHALSMVQHLGGIITPEKNSTKLTIKSEGLPIEEIENLLNSGNSGITTRFFLPVLGLRKDSSKPIVLDCGDQMRKRPIQQFIDVLIQLGMKLQYVENEGMLPIKISGDLIGGNVKVNGLTSQYLSSLLFTLAFAKTDSSILVEDLHERPYMEMTLKWLDFCGIRYQHTFEPATQSTDSKDTFVIYSGQNLKSFSIDIPSDFSSASTLIASGVLLDGKIELNGLDMEDSQGDKRLISILRDMGADITIHHRKIIIRGGKKLKGIRIDANDIPDLLPVLSVIGTQASGKTEIVNVEQARIKETDRIHSMREGLSKMGAKIIEYKDGLEIEESKLSGAHVKGYDDHRTVMALALAGLIASGTTIITDEEAINKTYPDFISHMQSLGAKLEVQHEK